VDERDIPSPAQTVHILKPAALKVGADGGEDPADPMNALGLGIKRIVVHALTVHAIFAAARDSNLPCLIE